MLESSSWWGSKRRYAESGNTVFDTSRQGSAQVNIKHYWTLHRAVLPTVLSVAIGAPCLAQYQAQEASGAPLSDLTRTQLNRFELGRAAYLHVFTAPEGLGPIMNQQACGNCHNNPIGGPGNISVTRFGMIDKKGGFDPLDSIGGSLLQNDAISPTCAEVIPPMANITTERVTNGALGYGLIEAIEETQFTALQAAQPVAQRGVIQFVSALEDPPMSPLRVGRFGWKAQVATILTFSGDAALNEMGLTNRLMPTENAPNGDALLLAACDNIADPEDQPDALGVEFIDRITDFQRFLAMPPQTPRSGLSGETTFNNIGCNVCHTTSYTTPNDMSLEAALRNKPIKSYSDFMLHDMGIAGDGITDGVASGRMLRTPPLWGMKNRDPMWHDGRVGAGTFSSRIKGTSPGNEGVIYWHNQFGSQAQTSAQAFFALSTAEQDSVVTFLASLGRLEFDVDSNSIIDVDDFNDLALCSGSGIKPNDPCAIHDVDQDGDVDLNDFDVFMTVFDGTINDCNNNGSSDLQDIFEGVSVDTNGNGIPDECDTCLGDANADLVVDINDFSLLLINWGPCAAPCMTDFDNSGTVGLGDFTILLTQFGQICDTP